MIRCPSCSDEIPESSRSCPRCGSGVDTPTSAADLTEDGDFTRTEPAPSGEASRSIGPYRLLEKIGEGGMGEVWLAEQSEPVQRKVALKVIKAGMDSRQIVARFEVERQALAMMDHPAIAKVHDAGTTPRGRPFFVMEHVRGVPINEHCDRQKLSNRERLDLFIQVCEGVQHAHQKAVIHRDLKPSNVLVSFQDGKATPKIIDFGVAKATAQKLTDKTMHTQLGVLIGTPEYMSPEQAEMTGQDIDTRTDVYAMGVMLYELLVGALPFDAGELRKAGFESMARKIREDEPPRPSARLSTLGEQSVESAKQRKTDLRTLRRELVGDLDWITMKALEKDRTRRYGSPQELAADIQRHLGHEPVLAGPPSTVYRMGKFARRHRFGVAASVVGALALVGFAVTMAVTARRIDAERQAAEAAKSDLERVVEFQAGMLGEVDAEQVGQRLFSDLRERVAEASLENGATEQEVEDALVSFDVMLRDVNATGAALRVIDEEILDLAGKALGERFGDQPLIEARLRDTIGDTYYDLGLHDRAAPHLVSALATRERLLGRDDPDTLESTNKMGRLLRAQGKLTEAEPYYREALEGRRRVLGADHADTLISIFNLGTLLRAQGKFVEAEPYYLESLEGFRRVLGDDDPLTLRAITSTGALYQGEGMLAEAELYFREALEGQRRTRGDDHRDTLTTINNIGVLLQSRGKLAEAEPYYLESLEGFRRILGDDHRRTLTTISNLGFLYQGQGKLAEAERYLREALERRRRVMGDDHPDTLISISSMGLLLEAQGELAEAEDYYREALERRRRVLGDDHPRTLSSISSIGTLLQAQGDLAAADGYFRTVLDTLRRTKPPGDAAIASALVQLGVNLSRQQRHGEAEIVLRESLEIRRAALPADHWLIPNTMSLLGEALAGQGMFARAEPMLLEGYTEMTPPDNAQARKREALDRIVKLYESWGKPEKAAAWSVDVPPRN